MDKDKNKPRRRLKFGNAHAYVKNEIKLVPKGNEGADIPTTPTTQEEGGE